MVNSRVAQATALPGRALLPICLCHVGCVVCVEARQGVESRHSAPKRSQTRSMERRGASSAGRRSSVGLALGGPRAVVGGPSLWMSGATSRASSSTAPARDPWRTSGACPPSSCSGPRSSGPPMRQFLAASVEGRPIVLDSGSITGGSCSSEDCSTEWQNIELCLQVGFWRFQCVYQLGRQEGRQGMIVKRVRQVRPQLNDSSYGGPVLSRKIDEGDRTSNF